MFCNFLSLSFCFPLEPFFLTISLTLSFLFSIFFFFLIFNRGLMPLFLILCFTCSFCFTLFDPLFWPLPRFNHIFLLYQVLCCYFSYSLSLSFSFYLLPFLLLSPSLSFLFLFSLLLLLFLSCVRFPTNVFNEPTISHNSLFRMPTISF